MGGCPQNMVHWDESPRPEPDTAKHSVRSAWPLLKMRPRIHVPARMVPLTALSLYCQAVTSVSWRCAPQRVVALPISVP